MGRLDAVLGRVGPYRTATLALLAVHAVAAVAGYLGALEIDPLALGATLGATTIGTLLTSLPGAIADGGRVHVESSLITGLILALLVWPALTVDALVGAGLVGAVDAASDALLRARTVCRRCSCAGGGATCSIPRPPARWSPVS